VLNEFWYNVVFLVLYNAVYIIILTCCMSIGHLTGIGCKKCIYVYVNLISIFHITAIFADIKTRNIHDMWFVVMTRIYIHTTCHVPTFNGFLVTTMQLTAKYRCYLFLRDVCYNTKYVDFRKVHAASLPSNTLFYMIC
jgi:hypothetical protein